MILRNNTTAVNNELEDYAIQAWGEGYFAINAAGQVVCRPHRNTRQEVILDDLVQQIEQQLGLPILVRFRDILTDRVQALCAAFDQAIQQQQYANRYTAIYPIKVNQQRYVVEQLLQAAPGRVGLEAGSKPELMAVLAQTFQSKNVDDQATIICNGYKDREYIRLALIGAQLGKRVFIVIEKPNELELVIQQARELGVQPRLGVRVRLAAVAKGRWQNSGGDKSKFGLTATQILALVNRLRELDQLDALQLLHFHIGSQIGNLQDIAGGVQEAVQHYQQLRKVGAAIQVFDIGGGLGIDYAGAGQNDEFSTNYNLADYAKLVVTTLAEQCRHYELPYPEIITESGRALTAHHAVLLTNVVDIEASHLSLALEQPLADAEYTKIAALKDTAMLESWLAEHEQSLQQYQLDYLQGRCDLAQRALLERQTLHAYACLREHLVTQDFAAEWVSWLDEKLAAKYFGNFSLFQSMPDIWGIDQILPVMPLHGLAEPPQAQAILHDLTCDSDGQVKAYVTANGIRKTLPVPAIGGQNPILGVFLVGAYQETLGDMHNLFGDTHTINVQLTPTGYALIEPEPGDQIDELLKYLHYDIQQLLAQYQAKLNATDLPAAIKAQYFTELEQGLQGYTYLEE